MKQSIIKNLLLLLTSTCLLFGNTCFKDEIKKANADDTMVAVYTVTGQKTAEQTGTAPEGSSFAYTSTYDKSFQLTGGNSMTLILSNYEGYAITGITLSMHSNKSAGQAALEITAGTTPLLSIAATRFNTATWYGNWSEEYVDITKQMTNDSYCIKNDEDILIVLSATANSIYCQSFSIEYTVGATDSTLATLQNDLNCVDSYFSLAYKYSKSENYSEGQIDTLDKAFTGNPSSYTPWSEKNGANSSAVYAGNNSGNYSSIQLRSSDASSIITTASGGNAAAIRVVWESHTTVGNRIDIYGKDVAYTATSELFSKTDAEKGTYLGSIIYGKSTYLKISGSYEYIGIRSYSGAVYLTSIDIVWNPDYSTEDVDFRLRVGVDDTISHLDNNLNYTYGIEVKTASKIKKYTFNATTLHDEEGCVLFQIIKLGDVLNGTNIERITDEFTIRAFAGYNNDFIYSTEKKHIP